MLFFSKLITHNVHAAVSTAGWKCCAAAGAAPTTPHSTRQKPNKFHHHNRPGQAGPKLA
jgi:hypothetical protein